MADLSKSDVQDAMEAALRSAGGNSAPKTAAAAPTVSDGGLVETFKRIAGEGVGVYTAFRNINQYSGYAANGLTSLAEKLPVGGDTLKGFVASAEAARQQNLKNAAVGIGGNALFEYDAKVGRLGMNQDQYREMLLRSGVALNGIGMTAEQGSARLLKLGDSVQQAGNAGYDLVKAGRMGQEELSKITVMSQYGSRANLDDINQRQRAAQAAGLLAAEIDKQSAITGKSRQVISQELEERLKQPEVLAQMRQMTDAQRESFIRGQAAITGLGKDAGDLGAVLARGGRLTEDNQKQLMAMGPAAGEFQRAMRMTALAQTDDQKRQAAEAVERAKAQVTAFQSSQQFANMMSNATPELARFYRSQYEQNVLRDRQAAAARETGGTVLQGARTQEQAVGEAAGGLRRDEAGKVVADERQRLSREVADAELKGASAANAMRQEIANLNTEFGRSPKVIEGFRNVSNTVYGPGGTVEQSQERVRQFGKDVVNLLGGNLKPAATGPETGPGSPGVPLPPPKKRAGGGEVEAGEMSIVGDGGPELIKGPASVTSVSETANILKNAVKDAMPDSAGVDIGAISDKINTTISAVAPKSEVEAPTSNFRSRNEELKRQAEEAIRIINESGQQQIDANIRLTKFGSLRMTEYFDEQQTNMQSLGQISTEERIAELVAQANRIKAQQTIVGEQKTAIELDQIANEATLNSTRQQAIEDAYSAMSDMSPEAMFAELPTALNNSLSEVKTSFDEFGNEIAISLPEPKAVEEVKSTTVAESTRPVSSEVPESKVTGIFDSLKTKFTSVFENIKLPDAFNTAKIAEPVRTIVPPPQPKAPPPPPAPKVEEPKPAPRAEPVRATTLDDLAKLLEQLNTTMAQVASHSENISEASSKTAKMSARATGNKNLA